MSSINIAQCKQKNKKPEVGPRLRRRISSVSEIGLINYTRASLMPSALILSLVFPTKQRAMEFQITSYISLTEISLFWRIGRPAVALHGRTQRELR